MFCNQKNPGERKTKLSKNVSHGIFLGYTAINRNVIFQDSLSNQFKRSRHVTFDKVFYNRYSRAPRVEIWCLTEVPKELSVNVNPTRFYYLAVATT